MTTTSPTRRDSDAELDRLGITRVATEHFLWGGYRYSHARDAIAAARRGGAR